MAFADLLGGTLFEILFKRNECKCTYTTLNKIKSNNCKIIEKQLKFNFAIDALNFNKSGINIFKKAFFLNLSKYLCE